MVTDKKQVKRVEKKIDVKKIPKPKPKVEAKPEIKKEVKTEVKVPTEALKKEAKPESSAIKEQSSSKSQEKPKEQKKEVKSDVADQSPAKTSTKVAVKPAYNFKLFDRWDMHVVVSDLGLKGYMNIKPILVPFSQGRDVSKQFWKSDKHIVERLILKMMVTGHKGKKHFRTSGVNTGQYNKTSKIVKDAFEIIERKTKRNPIQVYIEAIERGAPKEGVTTIEYGGVRYPKAVDLSPQRRIDLALRWICQGAAHSKSGKGKRQSIAEALSEQIMSAAQEDQKSNSVQKTFELERQAQASR